MSDKHATVPHDELFWAELDTSVLPSAKRRDPVRLGYLFESVLPCPIDDIHAVYANTSPTRAIACGIDRSRIAAFNETISLSPDGVPSFIVGVDPSALNLLVGEFEPDAVRTQRRRWSAWAAAALLAVTTVVGIGIERRVMYERRLQDQATESRDRLYAEHFDEALLRRQPAHAVLTAELRKLRATRAGSRSDATEPEPAAAVLSRFMQGWPTSIDTRTESIEASGGAVRVSMLLDDTESAERFRAAYSELEGWIPDGHQNVDRVNEEVRLTMRVAPAMEDTP